MLVFENNTLKQINTHAQADYPKECCGIMLGECLKGIRYVYKVIPTHNIAEKSENTTHFSIDPLEVVKAERLAEKNNLEIVGFYHSHPDYDAVASSEDILYMLEGYSYPIVSVKNGTCVKVISFEKKKQTDVDVKEEMVKEK